MENIATLFLAANPVGTSQLALDEEIREITQKIRMADGRDVLQVISVWAVRADDLLQYLNQHRPQIVHFSGHGSKDGELILLDNQGKPKAVSPVALKALFTTLKDNIQVVVLNACYSRIQGEAINEVIDFVVGMNKAIGDRAAIIFAASFYRALGFNRTVQEAFEQAQTALLLEGIPEDTTPELLIREGVSPNRRVNVAKMVGEDSHSSTDGRGLNSGINDPDVMFNLSVVDDHSENAISNYWRSAPTNRSLTYRSEMISDEIHIWPESDYLSALYKGGPISGMEYWYTPFSWEFPELDIKIVNNRAKTMFFTNAKFRIVESKVNPQPILVIERNLYNLLHFRLVNEGWGHIRDCIVKFNIKDLEESFSFTDPLPFIISKDGIDSEYNIDITNALGQLGVKFRDPAHTNINYGSSEPVIDSGPFGRVVQVYGTIRFKFDTVAEKDREVTVKFSTHVSLFYPGPGAPAPPTYLYEVMFRLDESNYELDVPISQVLKSGEADRFKLKIGAPKSSVHQFQLTLMYGSGQAITSPMVNLSLLLPRSQVRYISSNEGRRMFDQLNWLE